MRLLRNPGYRVGEAANGAEAQALLQSRAGPLHLLLTEAVMSGMSGRKDDPLQEERCIESP